jgi:broad specificity phosphatase PhoE
MTVQAPTTRVYLLRHAETANPQVFHGAESDVDLSARGRRQAEAVAQVLAAQRPDVVISSAMRRAWATAAPIARACGVPHLIEPALHERRVGALSGMPTDDNGGVWPGTMRAWMAGETDFAPEGAESFDDIRARVLPVWQRLTQEHSARCLVVVCHGIICRVLLLSLLPGHGVADWQRIATPNVGISELEQSDGQWSARRISEVPATVAAV